MAFDAKVDVQVIDVVMSCYEVKWWACVVDIG